MLSSAEEENCSPYLWTLLTCESKTLGTPEAAGHILHRGGRAGPFTVTKMNKIHNETLRISIISIMRLFLVDTSLQCYTEVRDSTCGMEDRSGGSHF